MDEKRILYTMQYMAIKRAIGELESAKETIYGEDRDRKLDKINEAIEFIKGWPL